MSKKKRIRFNAPSRIALFTSLGVAIIALLSHLGWLPWIGERPAFWLLTGAYSFLLWATVLCGM